MDQKLTPRLMDFYQNSFERVLIDRESLDSAVAKRVMDIFPQEKIQVIDQKPYESKGTLSASEFNLSKKQIHITPHRGAFFKRCPGAKPGLVCCNYFVLNLGLQCNMNCTYCYLQSYINTPFLTIYSNLNDAIGELKEIADQYPQYHYRVGTGETIDSLSMDPLTGYSRELISFFKNYPNWILEFKTKSNLVDQFLDEDHAGNVLVSWSMNPQNIISSEEHGTASLQERLAAARKCRDKKFKIAFHLDPMIYHKDWQNNYSDLVTQITNNFSPDEVDLVTIGSVRFKPEQRYLMKERFGPESLIFQGEFFKSDTGKMRYDAELRNEMFQFVKGEFERIQSQASHKKGWRMSLCMEVPETWATTMASTPRKIPEIDELFSPRPKTLPQPRL